MIQNVWVSLPQLQPVMKTCLMPSLSPPPSMSWTMITPVIIPCTVFVGGLGKEVGEEQLEEIFSVFGKVKKGVVVVEKDGGSKGYGFVTFQDEMVLRKVEQEEIIIGGRLLSTAQAVGMVPVTVHQGADGPVQHLHHDHPVWYPAYPLYHTTHCYQLPVYPPPHHLLPHHPLHQ